ncbi:interleukin-5 receptor subunit alpha-like [Hemibagrus wyckioides]|nr:interleukin-5 receptor subunit alpha-like [Hemibagrus wyckioides]
MRLCELLVTLSLFLVDVNGDNIDDSCTETNATVEQTMDSVTHINSSIYAIRCVIYDEDKLNCSWSTDSLPENAQYSAFYILDESNEVHHLNCVSDSSKKLVECHRGNNFFEDSCLSVKVNVTINGYWYIILQNYETTEIEVPSPPEITIHLYKSRNLEIQWLQTRSFSSKLNKCFTYGLKINNELVNVTNKLAYNVTNFEPTKSYTIQIRSKQTKSCVTNAQWSEWSTPIVVGPAKPTYELNAGVIASIVFVLPMILLAFLLVCKFQRLFDKLFPSIPNPSRNVQMILEKNYYNQDMPAKQCEEGAEILEVIG